MAYACTICGCKLPTNTLKCNECRTKATRSAPDSVPDPAQVLSETVSVSSPERFQVTRVKTKSMVFTVTDTLTGTIREVTNDPVDALEVAERLNTGFIYAHGARWRAPA